ncbi:MAG: DUF2752 domain-containing protein [Myxococcota bacterium]
MRDLLDRFERIARRAWFGDAVFLTVSVAILAAAAILHPSSEAVSLFGIDVPVLCTWRRFTGYPCPGCGLTRSFVFLAHGQLRAAFGMNLFGPPAFVYVAAQVPWRLIRIARRQGWIGPRTPTSPAP